MKYLIFRSHNSALAYAKEHHLKVIKGRIDGKCVWFVGTWQEPMLATIYKPQNTAKTLPAFFPKNAKLVE